jgi:hypothetical protein
VPFSEKKIGDAHKKEMLNDKESMRKKHAQDVRLIHVD